MKNQKTNQIKRPMTVYSVTVFTILMLYIVVLVVPLLWGLMTSFKDSFDFMQNTSGLPEEWLFSNYMTALKEFFVRVRTNSRTADVYMPEMYLNTLLYAGSGAFAATLTPCAVAYCTAKFRYKFSGIITGTVLFCMIMPIVGNLPAEIRMARLVGVYDNIALIWIMRANFLGIYFLVFQVTFKGLPNEFVEAAKIDGASNLKVFIKVMLPLVLSTFFTIFLIQFVQLWNDYQVALIYIPSNPTIAYGMYNFSFSQENAISSVPLQLTGAMLVFIPIFVVFAVFHDRLMGNMTMGGIKG